MSAPVTAVTAAPYLLAYRHLGRGRLGDLLTGDVRLMLTTAAYTPAPGDEWVDVPADAETYGPGYPTSGQFLDNRTFDIDPALGRAVLRCDPLVFPDAGFSARWGVFYVATGDQHTSPLLSYVDLGAELDPAGTDLTLTFTAGVFRIGPATLPG